MVTITIVGLDQTAVMYYSKENTKDLADLFETSEDEINFVSLENCVYHNGVEQTSWNTFVTIDLPFTYKLVEKIVADYIAKTLNAYAVNINVRFNYFDDAHEYEFIDKEYARFATEESKVEVEDSYYDEDHEETPHHCECKEHNHECHCEDCDCEEEDEEEENEEEFQDIFLGNAFDD